MTMPDCARMTSFWSRDVLTDTCKLPRCSRINVVGSTTAAALEVVRGPSQTDDSTAIMPDDLAVRNLSWTVTLTADLSDGQTWRYSTKDLPGWLNVNMPDERGAPCPSTSKLASGLTVVELESLDAITAVARNNTASCSSPADGKRPGDGRSITSTVSVNRLRHHVVMIVTSSLSSIALLFWQIRVQRAIRLLNGEENAPKIIDCLSVWWVYLFRQ